MNESKGIRTPLLEAPAGITPPLTEEWYAKLERPLPKKWQRVPWLATIGLLVISAVLMALPFILIAAKINIAIAIARFIFILGFFTILASLIRQFFLIARQDNIDERCRLVIKNSLDVLYRKTVKIRTVVACSIGLAAITMLAVFYLPAFGVVLTDTAALAFIVAGITAFTFTIAYYAYHFWRQSTQISQSQTDFLKPQIFTAKTILILILLIVCDVVLILISQNLSIFAEEAFLGFSAQTILSAILFLVSGIVILGRFVSIFSSLVSTAKADLSIAILSLEFPAFARDRLLRIRQELLPKLHPEFASVLPEILLALSKLEEPKREQFIEILLRDERNLVDACDMFYYMPPLDQDPRNFQRLIEHLDQLHVLHPILMWMDKYDLLITNGAINQANFDKLLNSKAANFPEILRGIRELEGVKIFPTSNPVGSTTEQSLPKPQFYFNLLLQHPDCAGSVGGGVALSYSAKKITHPATDRRHDFLHFEGLQALAQAGLLGRESKTTAIFTEPQDEADLLHVGHVLHLLQKRRVLTRELHQSIRRCVLNAKELIPILILINKNNSENIQPRSSAFQGLLDFIESKGGTNKRLPGILAELEQALGRLYSSCKDTYLRQAIAEMLLANPPLAKFFDYKDFKKYERSSGYKPRSWEEEDFCNTLAYDSQGRLDFRPYPNNQSARFAQLNNFGYIFGILEQFGLLEQRNYERVMQWHYSTDVGILGRLIKKILDSSPHKTIQQRGLEGLLACLHAFSKDTVDLDMCVGLTQYVGEITSGEPANSSSRAEHIYRIQEQNRVLIGSELYRGPAVAREHKSPGTASDSKAGPNFFTSSRVPASPPATPPVDNTSGMVKNQQSV